MSADGRAQERTGRDFPEGLTIDLTYNYYEVDGSTFEDIHRSLQSRGPEVDGRTYYALTGVETGFRYKHVEDGPICKLDDVGVQARVVMRLPQWSGHDAAAKSVRDAWEVFVNRLIRHEAEHYRIIEEGARRIYNHLQDLTVHSCQVADAGAQRIIRRISDDQASANESFDYASNHGARDGAVWPPAGL